MSYIGYFWDGFRMSSFIKESSRLYLFAFSLAIEIAFEDISIAETLDWGRLFFKDIAMHPDPVPMSRIDIFLLKFSCIIRSTSSSVSGLGIRVSSFYLYSRL